MMLRNEMKQNIRRRRQTKKPQKKWSNLIIFKSVTFLFSAN
jgi:hypothetical protein